MKWLTATSLTTALVAGFVFTAQAQTTMSPGASGAQGIGAPEVTSKGPDANAPRADSGAAARNSDGGGVSPMSGNSGLLPSQTGAGLSKPNVTTTGPNANAPHLPQGAEAHDMSDGETGNYGKRSAP